MLLAGKREKKKKPVKLHKCQICREPYERMRPRQKVCSPACAIEAAYRKAEEDAKKFKAKERKEDKEKRERFKSRNDWISECQTVVNKVVRMRDILLGRGCVSCGSPYRGAFGGAFDAGHFRSTGSAPHLRFYTPNISLQCVKCNRHQGGRALEFRKTLIARRGVEWVEKLEAMHHLAKFDVDYLKRLKKVMGKRARRLEKLAITRGLI